MKPSEHLDGDEISDCESVAYGTHPPYPSVSHPVTHDTFTDFGKQLPSPSLYFPVGQTTGVTNSGVTSLHFPYPSLSYPVAQITGTDEATQFPYPSESKPVGQRGAVGIGAGVNVRT